MRIVDVHAHVDVLEPLNWLDTADKLIGLMDEAGIENAAVSAYLNLPGPDPDSLVRLCESAGKYGDRLLPFVRMDPWFGEETVRLLVQAARDFNIRGVKLHPAHYTLHPFGDLTVNLVRKAGELGLPVLFHCGDEAMCLPLQIGELALKCPETTIILAHMGGFTHGRDAITVAERCENVYVDTSEVPLVDMIRHCVEALGSERVLFGSDAPCCDPLVELEKVRLAGLSEEDLERVCSLNAIKLLGLAGGAAR